MSRRAWAWCAGTLVVLVLVTALATMALMDANRDGYSFIKEDPQGNDQQWEALLAAVNLAVALPRARSAVGSLWMIDELGRHGFSIDPDLLHDPGVLAFRVVGLVAFPLWALIGLGAGLGRHPLKAAAFGLAWYPANIAPAFGGFGLANAFLPFYSNLGTALLMVKWPATALVVTLVTALWAAGLCVHGFAARIAKARAAAQGDQ